MKTIKILTIFTLFFSGLISCQTIINIDGNYQPNIPNAYYKDVGNKLNQFEGTWVYDDGVDFIKLVLVKKLQTTVWNHYEDYLVGEFKYKHSGFEIINTLGNLSNTLSDPRHYGINGNDFWYNHSPFSDFTNDNFRLKLSINENDCISILEMRRVILNGQQAIQIYKWKSLETTFSVCYPIIPEGFYYLIKQ